MRLNLLTAARAPIVAQFEELAHVVVGFVRQDLRDRALVDRGHAMTARIDRRRESAAPDRRT